MQWGQDSKSVFTTFITETKGLVKASKVTFYMTPTIRDELLGFFDATPPEYIHNFLTLITIQSPDPQLATIAGSVVRELIDEARSRSYRGMKIAEEEIDAVARRVRSSS